MTPSLEEKVNKLGTVIDRARSKGQPGLTFLRERVGIDRVGGWVRRTRAAKDRFGCYPAFLICSITTVWGWGMMSIPFLPWLLTR